MRIFTRPRMCSPVPGRMLWWKIAPCGCGRFTICSFFLAQQLPCFMLYVNTMSLPLGEALRGKARK
jgi:hypothetical protein